MNYIAIDANGAPWPHMIFEVGGPGGKYQADANGVIASVKPNHAASLIASGAAPLVPPSLAFAPAVAAATTAIAAVTDSATKAALAAVLAAVSALPITAA